MFFFGFMVSLGIYILVAYIKKLKPFDRKTGDVCIPTRSERDDHGVSYTIKNDKCQVETCMNGYSKSGNSCVDDLESEYIGVVGIFTGTENTAPTGYRNSDIDEELIIPFQAGDAQQNITVTGGGALSSDEPAKLSNLCRRTCVRTDDCTGVFLYDDQCIMLSSEFDYENDVDTDIEGTKILQKK